MLEAVDGADLVALTFPLYVDSLPAPTVEALERIAAHRQARVASAQRSARFAAIANCGFPEPRQNATALAICETFAQQAGYGWSGGLAMGGGGMGEGRPLTELGARSLGVRTALDQAGRALAQGEPIPSAARDLMAKQMGPSWIYPLAGRLIWRSRAKAFGAQRDLNARPYLEPEPQPDAQR
jgi:hypothetical protein